MAVVINRLLTLIDGCHYQPPPPPVTVYIRELLNTIDSSSSDFGRYVPEPGPMPNLVTPGYSPSPDRSMETLYGELLNYQDGTIPPQRVVKHWKSLLTSVSILRAASY